MINVKKIYIKWLLTIFIFLLVVLFLINKNRIDYAYLGIISILILKFYIERFKK